MTVPVSDPRPRRLLPLSLAVKLRHAGRMVMGAVLFAVVAGLWSALATWSISDPVGASDPTHTFRNVLGPHGAAVSDFVLQSLGVAGVVTLLAPLMWALELLSRGRLVSPVLRVLAWLASVPLLAVALAALPATATWPLPQGYGGVLGDTLMPLVARAASAHLPDFFVGWLEFMLGAGALWLLMIASAIRFADLRAAFRSSSPKDQRTGLYNITDTTPPKAKAPRGARPQGAPPPMPHSSGFKQFSPLDGETDDLPRILSGSDGEGSRNSATASLTSTDFNAERIVDTDEFLARSSPLGSPPSQSNPASLSPTLAIPPDELREENQPQSPRLMDRLLGAATSAGARSPEQQLQRPATELSTKPEPSGRPSRGAQGSAKSAKADAAARQPNLDRDSQEMAQRFAPRTRDERDLPDDEMESPTSVLHGAASSIAQPIGATIAAIAERTTRRRTNDQREVQSDASAFAEDGHAAPISSGPQDGARPATTQDRPDHVASAFAAGSGTSAPYRQPSLRLLDEVARTQKINDANRTMLRGTARLLEDVLGEFQIKGQVTGIRSGPVVSLFEFEPRRGVNTARVLALAEEIGRALELPSVRIAQTGDRRLLTFELPVFNRATIQLRELLEEPSYRQSGLRMPLAVGRQISGEPLLLDLARLKSLAIAGHDGAEVQSGLDSIVLSLIYKNTPDECRLAMADLEDGLLEDYDGVPHALRPVVRRTGAALALLRWTAAEVAERKKRLTQLGVRDLDAYNKQAAHVQRSGREITRSVQTGFDRKGNPVYETLKISVSALPRIVAVVAGIDRLAEANPQELRELVGAIEGDGAEVGVHLVVATLRPTPLLSAANTGPLLANRMVMRLRTRSDSRDCIGSAGAEMLLGASDMIVAGDGQAPLRTHGPTITARERSRVVTYLRGEA